MQLVLLCLSTSCIWSKLDLSSTGSSAATFVSCGSTWKTHTGCSFLERQVTWHLCYRVVKGGGVQGGGGSLIFPNVP